MAMKLADVVSLVLGDQDVDVQLTAYDGSRHGPADCDVRLDVRSPRAVSLLMSAPGQLGLARAYVAGELEVYGDLFTALDRLARLGVKEPTASEKVKLFRALAPFALRREPPPPEEVRLGGSRHSKRRDADAISHHYDVSNTFYRWVLGPSMAYTCAVYPKADATLEEAQEEKFDLVCRKLGLQRGSTWAAAGAGCCSTRPSTTASAASASRPRASRSREHGSAARGGRSRSSSRTTATSPAPSTACCRSG